MDEAKAWLPEKTEWDFDGLETMGLLEYLLGSFGEKPEEVFTDQMEPLEKRRIQELKEALEKAQELRLVGPKLLSLPGLLKIDFDPGVALKVQAFLDKFDEPKTFLGKVLQYFVRLPPGFRSLSRAKARFVEELCSGPKPESKRKAC